MASYTENLTDPAGRKMFERFSKDEKSPAWLRTANYCYAHMDRTRHCPLRKGTLEGFLGTNDRGARRAVQQAIERTWLAPESNTRCLVAPIDMQYGAGNFKPARAVCDRH